MRAGKGSEGGKAKESTNGTNSIPTTTIFPTSFSSVLDSSIPVPAETTRTSQRPSYYLPNQISIDSLFLPQFGLVQTRQSIFLNLQLHANFSFRLIPPPSELKSSSNEAPNTNFIRKEAIKLEKNLMSQHVSLINKPLLTATRKIEQQKLFKKIGRELWRIGRRNNCYIISNVQRVGFLRSHWLHLRHHSS